MSDFTFIAKFRLKLKKVGKTTRPFRYDLNQIPYDYTVALQIAVKRREAKNKREKERYKNLNAEFQRIARRDKKAFLHEQCKETENKRMEKTKRSVKEN